MKKHNIFTQGMVSMVLILALGGCGILQTDYERPRLAEHVFITGSVLNSKDKAQDLNGEFVNYEEPRVLESPEAKLATDFWLVFNDEHLTALIEEVLRNGGDYKSAVIAAQRALVTADITATNLIPELNANLDSSMKKSFNDGVSRKNSGSNLQVSYEIDLFGKLAAERKEQLLEAQASIDDALASRLTVASNVAILYWKLVYTKDLLKLDEANLEDAKQTVAIMEARYALGKVSKLELLQAQRDLVEQQSALVTDTNALNKTILALNALRNVTPNTEILTADTLIDLTVPTVNLNRGSDLLGKRPDMRAHENRLRSALSKIDVAKLKIYPSLSLNGMLNAGSSNELYEFFKDPLGSITAALTFPFLNFYQNSLDIDIAKLSYDSAEISFISAYYLALSEVSQAQEDLTKSASLYEHDAQKLHLTTGTESIYKARYEAGNVALKDYLEAKALRRSAQKAVIGDVLEQLDGTVVLIKALGGI